MLWDSRYWAKHDLINFIEMYKSYPCLWKTKSKEYTNKHLKNGAYEKLVELCRNTVNPEANRDFVTKKIQSLRGSFRKELKKVYESKASGVAEEDVYKPNLWYFSYLLFTQNQEPSDSTTDDVKIELDADDDVDYDEADGWLNSPECASETKTEIEEIITEIPNKEQMNTTVNMDTYCSAVHKGAKRKITTVDRNLPCMQVCQHVLENTNTEINEFDAVGISVGKKLQRMDSIQAIYAESLINKVLSKGLLNHLSENIDVCEKVQYSISQTHHFSMTNSPTPGLSSTQSGIFSQVYQDSDEILSQNKNEK
ncbi:hypothetical protein NQ314_002633 [Rhamnusium bicolor]|uniref:MADF domain-containing protein n=1 Tax=Rhamnusium bicolor TaxID=1586634 RepID=A0AAV8ZQE1_9CUCU|nr:hypothetical protein NQ314_002633 [Rhamnusium bicolor]